jgi:acetolactate synthase I/III small subunit
MNTRALPVVPPHPPALPVVPPHPTAPAAPAGSTSPRSGEEGVDRLRVLSLVVEDGPGTLSKVSGLIRRRGFHVRAISVGPSREPGLFRMTLTVDSGHAEVDQVRKQLERLVEVVEVEDLTGHDVHSRELVVARVAAADLSDLIERGAKVLHSSPTGTTVEFAGDGSEVGDFVEDLRRHGVQDVVRSGPVVMRRSA